MKKIFAVCAMLGVVGGLFFADDAAAKTRRIQKPRQMISLKASPDSLARQNEVIDRYGLPRIQTRAELKQYVAEHFFVRVSSPYLWVEDDVGGYALPPTGNFAVFVSNEFLKTFGRLPKLTSFLRTAEDQKHIVVRGQSIADGSLHELQSSHLAGVAFDISKKPLNEKERRWLLRKLFAYKKAGKIEAIEEMWNNAFHIMVCPNWQTGSCF